MAESPAAPDVTTAHPSVREGQKRLRRELSRKKRLLFGTIVCLATYALIELASLTVLISVHGSLPRPGDTLTAAGPADGEPGAEISDRIEFVHPYFGFMHQTDRPAVVGTGRYSVSEFGFADDASPIRRREPGKLIVCIMGGSLAEEFAVASSGDLADRLKQSPAFADREIVFVRTAVAGFKQPQQLMVLNYLLSLGAEFDVLINIDGFNEAVLPVLENVPNDVAVSFPRSWHSRILDVYDTRVLRLVGRTVELKARRGAAARTVFGTWLQYSPTARFCWKEYDNMLVRRIQADYARLNALVPDRLKGMTGPAEDFANLDEQLEYAVAIWRRSSLQMDRICKANGIAYYHFLQPNQHHTGSKPTGDDAREPASQEQTYHVTAKQGYPILIREGANLAREGVRFYDLTQIFSGHSEAMYRDDCCHLTAGGNVLLSQSIAEAIVANPPSR